MKIMWKAFAFVLGAVSVTASSVLTFDPNTGFTTHANVAQTIGWASM
jgi:hypothetical protein